MKKLLIFLLMPLILSSEIKFDGNVDLTEWSDGKKFELLYETSPSYNGAAEHQTISFVKNDKL